MVSGLVLVAAVYWASNKGPTKLMRETPRTAIADFSGKKSAKLIGHLHYLGEPLVAPISGRPCAYYSVSIERNSVGRPAETLSEESKGVAFEIVDGTGRIVVDPAAATVLVVLDSHTKSGFLNSPTESQLKYLETREVDCQNSMGYEELVYHEGVLEEGEYVVALGHGTMETDLNPSNQGKRGYRDGPVSRWRMQGHAKKPLMISDDIRTL